MGAVRAARALPAPGSAALRGGLAGAGRQGRKPPRPSLRAGARGSGARRGLPQKKCTAPLGQPSKEHSQEIQAQPKSLMQNSELCLTAKVCPLVWLSGCGSVENSWQALTYDKFHLIPKLSGLTPEQDRLAKNRKWKKHFAYWKPPFVHLHSSKTAVQLARIPTFLGGIPRWWIPPKGLCRRV